MRPARSSGASERRQDIFGEGKECLVILQLKRLAGWPWEDELLEPFARSPNWSTG